MEIGHAHVFNYYVVRTRRRDELKDFLADRGIQSEVYYPLPLHLQECFRDLGYREGTTMMLEERSLRELLVWMHRAGVLDAREVGELARDAA